MANQLRKQIAAKLKTVTTRRLRDFMINVQVHLSEASFKSHHGINRTEQLARIPRLVKLSQLVADELYDRLHEATMELTPAQAEELSFASK